MKQASLPFDEAPLGPATCGLDEAGRGPLAGPVYAAAAILPEDFPLSVLDDSKALSERRRNEAFELITARAAFAIEWVGAAEIDRLDILAASLLAMERAYLSLLSRLVIRGWDRPRHVLVDGNRLPHIAGATAIVGGDGLVPAIMAASICAKVARDRAMERFDWLYPAYGYARHKGYPTRAHRAIVLEIGPSPIQRRSFRVR
ncbi:MAG: ribonuclease HII [Rectinemataceae bacterium]